MYFENNGFLIEILRNSDSKNNEKRSFRSESWMILALASNKTF